MDSPTPATDAHCGPSAPVRGSVGGAHSSWPHRPAPRAPRRSPADLRQLARLPCRLRHPHTPALRGTAPRRPSAARATEQCNKRKVVHHITPYGWTKIPLIAILTVRRGKFTRLLSTYRVFSCPFPRTA